MGLMNWDLSQCATRQHVFEEVCRGQAALAEQVREQAAQAGVPDRHHHDFGEVMQTIDALEGIPEQVREDMRGIYRILAEAEASVHGCEVDHTHFHEVGEGSHVRSVLEICLALRSLAPEHVVSTAVQVGSGQVQCAHGLLDVPAPATAAILARGIPVAKTRLDGELCTPTSAALILHFVDEYI